MKLSPFKFLALAALAAVLATAQTTAPAQPATQAQQQMQQQHALAISQQANQLLANPALLFSQLDVDNDGLLNLNEFAQIAALSTQPVVVPNADGSFTPNNGVAPMNGPNGAYTPNTGVPAATNNNGVITPNTGVAPPNMRSGPAIPNTGPAIPTRPNP